MNPYDSHAYAGARYGPGGYLYAPGYATLRYAPFEGRASRQDDEEDSYSTDSGETPDLPLSDSDDEPTDFERTRWHGYDYPHEDRFTSSGRPRTLVYEAGYHDWLGDDGRRYSWNQVRAMMDADPTIEVTDTQGFLPSGAPRAVHGPRRFDSTLSFREDARRPASPGEETDFSMSSSESGDVSTSSSLSLAWGPRQGRAFARYRPGANSGGRVAGRGFPGGASNPARAGRGAGRGARVRDTFNPGYDDDTESDLLSSGYVPRHGAGLGRGNGGRVGRGGRIIE